MKSDFERIGGEPVLRALIADFTTRVFDDVMIGFLFDGKPKSRITEMEYRLAAEHLGGPVVYNGRSMHEAHRGSPIMGGHFNRRRQILVETMTTHGVSGDVQARWLAHVDGLRAQVLGLGVDPDECDHLAQAERVTGQEDDSEQMP
jgi:hemoglobin